MPVQRCCFEVEGSKRIDAGVYGTNVKKVNQLGLSRSFPESPPLLADESSEANED